MSSGFDMLGAETPAESAARVKSATAKHDAAQRAELVRSIAGGAIGLAVGGGVGTLLWSSHRLWGFLIGAVLGFPPGFLVAKKYWGEKKMLEMM